MLRTPDRSRRWHDRSPAARYAHVRTAVHRHHRDVAGQERTAPVRALAPMQHGGAGEMPAAAHQQNIIGDAMAVALPRHDRRVRPRHPLRVVAVQIDRRVAERRAPVGNRAIIMRMRDRDRLQPAERPDMRDRLGRGQRHAVPHHAAAAIRHQERTLPDRKGRLERQSDQAEIVAPDQPMPLREPVARQPRLPFPVHILPLVLADRAGRWRRRGFGKLRAALFAGPERH